MYCAPNLGGESFGIVLVEALAAGTAVVASPNSTRSVVCCATAVPVCSSPSATRTRSPLGILEVLDDDTRRDALVEAGTEIVGCYDWPVVAEQILRVYETVTVGAGRVREVRS